MGNRLIELQNITKIYDGHKVLDDLNLYFPGKRADGGSAGFSGNQSKQDGHRDDEGADP